MWDSLLQHWSERNMWKNVSMLEVTMLSLWSGVSHHPATCTSLVSPYDSHFWLWHYTFPFRDNKCLYCPVIFLPFRDSPETWSVNLFLVKIRIAFHIVLWRRYHNPHFVWINGCRLTCPISESFCLIISSFYSLSLVLYPQKQFCSSLSLWNVTNKIILINSNIYILN